MSNRTPSEQIIEASYQVAALLTLCECAAWSLRNNMADLALVSDSIHTALLMAKDLHGSVHDFIEAGEGMKEAAA
ncbi:hypothetical protein [Aerobium aerolatum]|uniref:Uncharacterized protein n=1 Tax=Aquamicrobium aerolatum DSM 21857 TaxID=1121003 RepID=A0A1I3SEQ0_9HYPH|nr:hypothetical protein [Aquamicrobium aerolatum]SFJ57304.1 hypothetical protein SAMN03080618_03352 [Aquamicrobium aerolatum DSM 21857]